MRYRDGRRSLCLSSQSGCPLTCTFCATGSMKFGRNLTASEILDQALHFRRIEQVDHAVFMGMGEPMMNLDAVLDACGRLPDVGVTHRRTAISTVGWIPGIERLPRPTCRSGWRSRCTPPTTRCARRSCRSTTATRWPTCSPACRRFHAAKRRLVFVEYVMLAGVNDRYEQAVALARRARPEDVQGQPDPLQPDRFATTARGREAIAAFQAALEEHGIRATVRLTRGRDIDAACGQLAAASARLSARRRRPSAARSPPSTPVWPPRSDRRPAARGAHPRRPEPPPRRRAQAQLVLGPERSRVIALT